MVFALLRRVRTELSNHAAPEPASGGLSAEASEQGGNSRSSRGDLQSQEDLLDLDEHDGDLLEVGGRSVCLRRGGGGPPESP